MENNETVPDDGCNWILEENSDEMVQNTLQALNVMEGDVKEKVESEITTFRDRLHMILNEQRLNCEYLFGIHSGPLEEDELQHQNMIADGYFSQEQPINYSIYQSHDNGSDSSLLHYDVDNASDRSMMSAENLGPMKEDRINEYIIRLTTATMKMSSALHKYRRWSADKSKKGV